MVYPSHIACYTALQKQIPVQQFKFLLDASHQHSFIFWSSIRGPIAHRILSLYRWCTVVSVTLKYDEPEVENVALAAPYVDIFN